jgi:hypothetical protein
MEFLVLDLALALAALLGYRVLQEVAREGFAVPPAATPTSARAESCCERGAPQRLINFW